MRAVVAAALSLLVACADGPTEVLVHFTADEALVLAATDMEVDVCAEDRTNCTYTERRPLSVVTFPTTVPVRPRDPKRRFYVEGRLTAGGTMISAVSDTFGFVEGERTDVYLHFAVADAGTDAGEDASMPDASAPDAGPLCTCPCDGDTCVDGRCVPATPIAEVHAGLGHACAVAESGALFCWGANADGQLGMGAGDFDARTAPSRVATPGAVAVVDASDDFTCNMQVDRTMWCWGDDDERQLGLGPCCNPDTIDQQAPARVGSDEWEHVALGNRHGCALSFTYPGQLWCWGRNDDGQLGEVTTSMQVASPIRIGSATDWRRVDAGGNHTCGIRNDGQLYCWGDGTFGKNGIGNDADQTTPQRVTAGSPTWAQVSAGIDHTCAVGVDGRAWCWGRGDNGRLGLGEASSVWSPRQVDEAGPADFTRVSAGYTHTCAIRSGELWCWGTNLNGELGAPSVADQTSVPVPVEGGPSAWRDVAVGQAFTCGAGDDGTLWCWGSADGGRLGLGDLAEDTRVPARACVPAG